MAAGRRSCVYHGMVNGAEEVSDNVLGTDFCSCLRRATYGVEVVNGTGNLDVGPRKHGMNKWPNGDE